MARARNIKPGFFQCDKLAEFDPLTRLVFIGMWTIADFKGCIEYRPKMLKVQLAPYDECDIETIANNLEQARFIRFYSVQGKRYIKIVNFEKHQNPHKNEKEAGSEIPDITEQDAAVNNINELEQDGIKPDLIGSATEPLALIPSTLIPSTLIPSSAIPESPQAAPKKSKRKIATSLPDDFYPNETGSDYANEKQLSISQTLQEFKNYHTSKGSTFNCWQAAWRTWCDNAVKFAKKNTPAQSKRDHLQVVADQLTGRSHVAVALG